MGKRYSVKYYCYSIYEDKVYPTYQLVDDAKDENEAYEIAEEMAFEFEKFYNRELLPAVMWFQGMPYFTEETLIEKAKNVYQKEVFLQTRNGEWFLYEDIQKPPLEALEVNHIQ